MVRDVEFMYGDLRRVSTQSKRAKVIRGSYTAHPIMDSIVVVIGGHNTIYHSTR